MNASMMVMLLGPEYLFTGRASVHGSGETRVRLFDDQFDGQHRKKTRDRASIPGREADGVGIEFFSERGADMIAVRPHPALSIHKGVMHTHWY